MIPSWSDFSFVVASRYREKVLTALSPRPKLPVQLAQETDLRLGHVSRALKELSGRRMVACLTPELRARGRLYGVTDQGRALLQQLFEPAPTPPSGTAGAPKRSEFVPKIRASTVLRVIHFLRRTRGEGPVAEALRDWPVNIGELTEDTWLPVATCAQLLDLIETRFGDGSYGFVRSMFAEAVASFPTVRAHLIKAVPIAMLARRAPDVYGKEWNYGRLEVSARSHRAEMRHYDWMPTPAMCAMFHGVYEGVLRARGVSGRVTKIRCVRNGDACCEYLVEW